MKKANGKVITFYSYKGGTGRTMALANVAWILASCGKKILVIDWDLEAPGLHRFFSPFLNDKDLENNNGLIDFLGEYVDGALDVSEDNNDSWLNYYADISKYANKLNYDDFPGEGIIDFVSAGKQDALYATRVNSFNWHNFYERLGGGAFFEEVKHNVKANYDYILIDSRTGVSDTAGICTIQWPDILVILFTGNNQSILGGVGVAHSVLEQSSVNNQGKREKPLIFPVLSRIDMSELDKFDALREFLKNHFNPIISQILNSKLDEYWGNMKIPYISWYSFEEVMAVFRDDPNESGSLLDAYQKLTYCLTNGVIGKLEPATFANNKKILSAYSRKYLSNTNFSLIDREDNSINILNLNSYLNKIINQNTLGLKNHVRIDGIFQNFIIGGKNLDPIQYYWSQSTNNSVINITYNSDEYFITANYINDGDYGCNFSIRPQDQTAVAKGNNRYIAFEARLSYENEEKASLGIRIVNGYMQHWQYSAGNIGEFIPFEVTSNQWIKFKVDLEMHSDWKLFESDGIGSRIDILEPDFSIISVINFSIGGINRTHRMTSGNIGKGRIDFKNIILE